MFSSPAYAQAAGAAGEAGGFAGIFVQMLPLIAIFGIFYLLLIRPQQKKMKDQRTAIDAVKKGDEVVTSGGHIGKVTKVSDHEVEVEFAAGHRHRVVRTMLHEVRPLGGGAPAND
jgi:preprotein translocase subunit YajC